MDLKNDIFVIDRTSEYWPAGVTCAGKLWGKGDVSLLSKSGVCIVGTRNPDQRGRDQAREAVDVLGSEHVIISGLALGIDACAHFEALAKGYPTIAVIGTPIDRYYPAEHKGLQQLIEQKGLVVSMFEPGSHTARWCFMKRNQLMAQLGRFSVVIQDGDGGGAVGQARYTLKEGKPVFITTQTYLNDTITWPKQLEGLSIVPSVGMIASNLEKAEQQKKREKALISKNKSSGRRVKASKADEPSPQLELF